MTTNLSRRDRMIAAIGGVVVLYAVAVGLWFMSQEQAWKTAAKKYEASPSRKDYQETMKRALEDGINDANMATERYKAMIRVK